MLCALQAGQLFTLAGQYERAAQLFLRCREFGLLDGVMVHAGSPALWLQYAQAKEGEWCVGGEGEGVLRMGMPAAGQLALWAGQKPRESADCWTAGDHLNLAAQPSVPR